MKMGFSIFAPVKLSKCVLRDEKPKENKLGEGCRTLQGLMKSTKGRVQKSVDLFARARDGSFCYSLATVTLFITSPTRICRTTSMPSVTRPKTA